MANWENDFAGGPPLAVAPTRRRRAAGPAPPNWQSLSKLAAASRNPLSRLPPGLNTTVMSYLVGNPAVQPRGLTAFSTPRNVLRGETRRRAGTNAAAYARRAGEMRLINALQQEARNAAARAEAEAAAAHAAAEAAERMRRATTMPTAEELRVAAAASRRAAARKSRARRGKGETFRSRSKSKA
jgi:hypothetical protein